MVNFSGYFERGGKKRTIIVLVEDQKGGLKAGQFVLNHLFTDKSRLVLLQVYKAYDTGQDRTAGFSEILKSTSLADLTILKEKLIEEFNIAPDKIEKLVAEGDVATVLKHEFNHRDNLVVIIGDDNESFKTGVPQEQVLTINDFY